MLGRIWDKSLYKEAEFLDAIGEKVLRVFLLMLLTVISSVLRILLPLEQKLFETGL